MKFEKPDNNYLLKLLKGLFDFTPPVESKLCKRCNTVKPLTDFYKSKSAKDGRQHHCAECNREKTREYNKLNPGRAKAYQEKKLSNPIEKEKHLFRVKRNQASLPSGVYAISDVNTEEVLYIGESAQPYIRMIQHFSETGVEGGVSEVSPIATDIGKGILKREDLVFEIIMETSEEEERKVMEQYFIKRLKPKYNTNYLTQHAYSVTK
jgi:hypothetical protein